MLIVRFDARLAFYNVAFFVQQLEVYERRAAAAGNAVHAIVIDCEGVNDIDTTALLSMSTLLGKYEVRPVVFLSDVCVCCVFLHWLVAFM